MATASSPSASAAGPHLTTPGLPGPRSDERIHTVPQPAPAREGTDPVFGNGTAHSRDQHSCLAAAYDPVTLPRLAAAGVGPGWHCLEVGAGGGSIARWLAGRVAPGGSVLATDLDPRDLAPGPRLEVAALDVARDPLPEAAYDLVMARLVLQHLPTRDAVLHKLVRALKPGGLLQIDELDASYEPPLLTPDAQAEALYVRFLRAKTAALRAAGGDPQWGRKVPAALRAAGLTAIDVHLHIGVRHARDPGLGLQLNHTRNLRDRLTEQGMTQEDLDSVGRLMRDPSFRAASSVLYSVQGRRPGRGRS
ncbi:class I SAM-dependent methyltransferase [Streptomyces cahuitamycinicus]|uniref:SAM-dependent methyltransferase n=1 Tax=Streptomyces cahuitamycinicus TaxID=2070367 RepID=A0A2N8TQU4_9ACTN|nr:methyltransferase domain-containing protein [Streptomyces cahuitamycinicus]PNG21375.1 SAM-dependent methyltransferase [Streptomyces cahuitamycinicus]